MPTASARLCGVRACHYIDFVNTLKADEIVILMQIWLCCKIAYVKSYVLIIERYRLPRRVRSGRYQLLRSHTDQFYPFLEFLPSHANRAIL